MYTFTQTQKSITLSFLVLFSIFLSSCSSSDDAELIDPVAASFPEGRYVQKVFPVNNSPNEPLTWDITWKKTSETDYNVTLIGVPDTGGTAPDATGTMTWNSTTSSGIMSLSFDNGQCSGTYIGGVSLTEQPGFYTYDMNINLEYNGGSCSTSGVFLFSIVAN